MWSLIWAGLSSSSSSTWSICPQGTNPSCSAWGPSISCLSSVRCVMVRECKSISSICLSQWGWWERFIVINLPPGGWLSSLVNIAILGAQCHVRGSLRGLIRRSGLAAVRPALVRRSPFFWTPSLTPWPFCWRAIERELGWLWKLTDMHRVCLAAYLITEHFFCSASLVSIHMGHKIFTARTRS